MKQRFRQRAILALICALLPAGLILATAVGAQSSTNYALERQLTPSGGGRIDSTNYVMEGALSLILTSCAESDNYALVEGCGARGPLLIYLYLPLVEKSGK